MRLVLCSMSLLVSSLMLVGCGQSGPLQLASDTNPDKRAHYLLYSNKVDQAKTTQQDPVQTDAVPVSSTMIETK